MEELDSEMMKPSTSRELPEFDENSVENQKSSDVIEEIMEDKDKEAVEVPEPLPKRFPYRRRGRGRWRGRWRGRGRGGVGTVTTRPVQETITEVTEPPPLPVEEKIVVNVAEADDAPAETAAAEASSEDVPSTSGSKIKRWRKMPLRKRAMANMTEDVDLTNVIYSCSYQYYPDDFLVKIMDKLYEDLEKTDHFSANPTKQYEIDGIAINTFESAETFELYCKRLSFSYIQQLIKKRNADKRRLAEMGCTEEEPLRMPTTASVLNSVTGEPVRRRRRRRLHPLWTQVPEIKIKRRGRKKIVDATNNTNNGQSLNAVESNVSVADTPAGTATVSPTATLSDAYTRKSSRGRVIKPASWVYEDEDIEEYLRCQHRQERRRLALLSRAREEQEKSLDQAGEPEIISIPVEPMDIHMSTEEPPPPEKSVVPLLSPKKAVSPAKKVAEVMPSPIKDLSSKVNKDVPSTSRPQQNLGNDTNRAKKLRSRGVQQKRKIVADGGDPTPLVSTVKTSNPIMEPADENVQKNLIPTVTPSVAAKSESSSNSCFSLLSKEKINVANQDQVTPNFVEPDKEELNLKLKKVKLFSRFTPVGWKTYLSSSNDLYEIKNFSGPSTDHHVFIDELVPVEKQSLNCDSDKENKDLTLQMDYLAAPFLQHLTEEDNKFSLYENDVPFLVTMMTKNDQEEQFQKSEQYIQILEKFYVKHYFRYLERQDDLALNRPTILKRCIMDEMANQYQQWKNLENPNEQTEVSPSKIPKESMKIAQPSAAAQQPVKLINTGQVVNIRNPSSAAAGSDQTLAIPVVYRLGSGAQLPGKTFHLALPANFNIQKLQQQTQGKSFPGIGDKKVLLRTVIAPKNPGEANKKNETDQYAQNGGGNPTKSSEPVLSKTLPHPNSAETITSKIEPEDDDLVIVHEHIPKKKNSDISPKAKSDDGYTLINTFSKMPTEETPKTATGNGKGSISPKAGGGSVTIGGGSNPLKIIGDANAITLLSPNATGGGSVTNGASSNGGALLAPKTIAGGSVTMFSTKISGVVPMAVENPTALPTQATAGPSAAKKFAFLAPNSLKVPFVIAANHPSQIKTFVFSPATATKKNMTEKQPPKIQVENQEKKTDGSSDVPIQIDTD